MAELATSTSASPLPLNNLLAREAPPAMNTLALTYPVVTHNVNWTKDDVEKGYGKIFPPDYEQLPHDFWWNMSKSIYESAHRGNCTPHHQSHPGLMTAAWYPLNRNNTRFDSPVEPHEGEACYAPIHTIQNVMDVLTLCANWFFGNHTKAGCCTFSFYEDAMLNDALDQHVKVTAEPVKYPVDGVKCNDTVSFNRYVDPRTGEEVGGFWKR